MIKPDRRDEMYCRVCGTKCDSSKGVESSVSMAKSTAGIKVKHDQLTCPHYDKEWQYKTCKLLKELEETESNKVSELISQKKNEMSE